MPSPLLIAHRGMPRRIRENTLPSFALAMDCGADALELDVHATADGTVVVHHDAVVAGGPSIAEVSLAELRQHGAAPDIPIPTLVELCALVAGRVALFVEIKGTAIERLVLDVLSGYRGEHAIHGFDHRMIRRVRALHADIRLGVLLEHATENVAEVLSAAGATDLWPHWSLVTATMTESVHAVGGRVIPWTVNEPADAASLITSGVDAICTDDVARLATLRRLPIL